MSDVHCWYYEKLYGKRCAADLIDLGLFQGVQPVSAVLWRIDSVYRACFHGNIFGSWGQLKQRQTLEFDFQKINRSQQLICDGHGKNKFGTM